AARPARRPVRDAEEARPARRDGSGPGAEEPAVSLAIQLRRHLHWILVMVAMFALASVVAVYIMRHERLRFPWEHPTQIWAEFSEAQAVTPGQGQTVDEAGVTVGEIGQVKLENGIALVRLDIK